MVQPELKGNIQFMGLGTLLSLNCNEGLTTRLVIENDETQAEIFIENGNIVHAMIDSETGETAFYKIFALKEGVFSSYPNQKAPQHSIEKNWSKLLLEGTRLLDESSTNQKQEMDWSNLEFSDFNIEQVEKIIDERMQRMVQALRRLEGVLGVSIIAHDSKVLEHDAEYDPIDCAQRAKILLSTGQRLGNFIGANYFMHTLIRNDQNTILINRGQDMIFLLANNNVILDVLIDEVNLIMKRYR